MLTKICNKCGRELPATNEFFHNSKKFKYGLASQCKDCKKQYRENNKEKFKEYSKKNYQKNKIRYSEEHKLYYKENREKIIEQHRQYREENKEKIAKHFKWYQENNKEKVYKHHKKHYYNNIEKESERKKRYQKENKIQIRIIRQRRRSKKLQLPSTLTKEQWEQIKIHFNNKCAYCGEERPLEQEHFIPLSKNGEYTVKNIIPACKSCNCSKGNKDFFNWYPKHDFYSKEREKFILNYLML